MGIKRKSPYFIVLHTNAGKKEMSIVVLPSQGSIVELYIWLRLQTDSNDRKNRKIEIQKCMSRLKK